jgi:2-polyprenyl-3-methyl-5-hydroxy-6-metoxy-1,4-benzoquinol methylase
MSLVGFLPCPLCKGAAREVIFTKKGYDLVRCGSCNLAYIGKPPSPEELQKLYSFEAGYQTGFADAASSEVKFHTKVARLSYKLLSQHRNAGKLLDVGCSAGFFLKEAHAHGWETHGLEYSPDTAAVAAKQPGLHIQSGTLEDANYDAQSFDVVTLWDVIEHVPDPLQTMRSVHHILNDDGLIALSTPNIDGLFPQLSYRVAQRLDYWPHPEPPHHLLQFSGQTLGLLLARAGFEIVATETKCIPLSHSFDLKNLLRRSPKLWLYTAAFLPIAVLSPWLGAGDWLFVFAKKK